jgi:hypothetical protein
LRLANEKMKVELTHLRRMRYGRSSEKMDAAQSQVERSPRTSGSGYRPE